MRSPVHVGVVNRGDEQEPARNPGCNLERDEALGEEPRSSQVGVKHEVELGGLELEEAVCRLHAHVVDDERRDAAVRDYAIREARGVVAREVSVMPITWPRRSSLISTSQTSGKTGADWPGRAPTPQIISEPTLASCFDGRSHRRHALSVASASA